MFNYVPFFKVLVLKIDVFESSVIDERHFSNDSEAMSYANTMNDMGYLPIVLQM